MTKLTELETMMLQQILDDYASSGVENTEFHNTFGIDAETNKKLRGAFTSLKRKKIVRHYNDKGCFNPIFPTEKLLEVCKENGVEISEKAMAEIKKYWGI